MTRHNPHLVPQFLTRHPSVDGYTLIAVLEEISRRVQASRDSLLATALVDRQAADYLVRVCETFQAQQNA
jgi:hypothetical protein